MTDELELPTGWTIWHEEPARRLILAYRPDVFSGGEFPAECLPTIFISDRPHRHRRPEQRDESYSSDIWHLTFFLEPDVVLHSENHGNRDQAVDAAIRLAEQFSTGDLNYRGAYQVPREQYLDQLDQLVSRDA